MPRKETKQEYKLYVPKSIDIDALLKRDPPKFTYKRDKFILILHLISSINADKKEETIRYTALYSPLLKSKIGTDYPKYFQYLIHHHIIVVDKRYSTISHTSKKYSFTDHHSSSELMEITITDKTTIKNATIFVNLEADKDLSILPQKDINDLQYLIKWFNEKLSIDFLQAQNYLIQLRDNEIWQQGFYYEKLYEEIKDPYNTFNKRLIPAYKIKNQQFTTNIDRTSYRFHSPLTSLKKELRKFVKYDGSTLVSIDIKNSQPYLSTVLFNKKYFKKNEIGSKIKIYNNIDYNNSPIVHYYVSKNVPPKDVTLFINQVKSGKFYEEFVRLLSKENLIPLEINDKRSYAKKVMFRTLFSPNFHKSFSKEIQVFEKLYPNVFQNFSFLKSNKRYNTLACLLQRIESELILEIICKKISDKFPSVPIFTIHDSVVTTLENRKKVEDIMRSTLTEFIGYKPQLSIEVWK